MTTRRHCQRIAALLLGACAPACYAADIGILTPAQPTLSVTVGWAPLETHTLGLVTAAKSGQKGELNGWAARDKLDLSGSLAQHLIASLSNSGHSAVAISVTRKSPDAKRPIARDEIPATPPANVLLDVTLAYAGLYSPTDLESLGPALLVDYRWLTPRGDLIQGTRLIIYNRGMADLVRRHGVPGLFYPLTRQDTTPYIDADPDCRFKSFKAVENDAAKLWACFDAGLVKVADQITQDMPSSRSASGGMTSERPPEDRP